jgi:hypothetical protein
MIGVLCQQLLKKDKKYTADALSISSILKKTKTKLTYFLINFKRSTAVPFSITTK